MSNGNNPALLPDDGQSAPQPGDQQQPAAGEQSQRLTFTDPQPEPDADELVLQQLEATAKAEEAGTANGQPKPGDGKDPAQGAPTAPTDQNPPNGQQQPPAGEQVMIPKARLDQALSERDQLREQNAYLRGQTEALQRQPAQAGQQPPQQQQQPTHEQRLASIKEERKKLAGQFDDGTLTAADWEDKRAELDEQAQAIREEQLAAKFKPAAPPQAQTSDSLYLDTLTAQIENDHPWVKVFSAVVPDHVDVTKDPDWMYVQARASDNMKAKGLPLNQGPITSYHLRKEMAVVMDQLGPVLIGDRAKALGIALPGAQQPPANQQQQQTPPLSPQAQARLNGLGKAAGAPPDLAALTGAAGDPAGQMTEERAEHISEDDFDKLPDAVRNKLLGISA